MFPLSFLFFFRFLNPSKCHSSVHQFFFPAVIPPTPLLFTHQSIQNSLLMSIQICNARNDKIQSSCFVSKVTNWNQVKGTSTDSRMRGEDHIFWRSVQQFLTKCSAIFDEVFSNFFDEVFSIFWRSVQQFLTKCSAIFWLSVQQFFWRIVQQFLTKFSTIKFLFPILLRCTYSYNMSGSKENTLKFNENLRIDNSISK